MATHWGLPLAAPCPSLFRRQPANSTHWLAAGDYDAAIFTAITSFAAARMSQFLKLEVFDAAAVETLRAMTVA